MARTPEKWSAVFSGPPQLVANHVEFPVQLLEEPDRPVVVTMPLSSARRLVKALGLLEARHKKTESTRTTSGYFDCEPG